MAKVGPPALLQFGGGARQSSRDDVGHELATLEVNQPRHMHIHADSSTGQ